MGKSKIRRPKKRAPCPTGIPSVKELEEIDELCSTNFETGTIESIIEKLNSSKADEKECAAVIVANMANSPSFVTSIIEHGIVRIASPLLIDRNISVRHAVAGCLRNLASSGDHPVITAMVDQDVMTSLVSLLKQYEESWTPVKLTDNKIDSKAEVFLEACNLLWSLCESSNTAVAIFNEKDLISILLPCLNIDVFGLHIPLAVAQCLHTVVEDNVEVIDKLSQPLIQEQLRSLMSIKPVEAEHVLLRILAAGITLNMYSGKLENCMPPITNNIIEAITATLELPILPTIEKLSFRISSHKEEKLNKYQDDTSMEDKMNAMNEPLTTLDYVLPAKQTALEMLANMCFGDDSNDKWEDLSSSDASESAQMDIDEAEFDCTPMKLGLKVPCEVHGIIVHDKLVDKVQEQIAMPPQETVEIIKEIPRGEECLKRLNTVRCRALLCLNNMVQSLDVDDLGGAPKLFDLWLNLANLVFKKTDLANTDQLEAATSSMRAVLQKLAEAECYSQFGNMTDHDLVLLIAICNKSTDSAIKVNIIRSIGTIGCLLGNISLNTSTIKLIGSIGTFLLEVSSKTSDLWVIAEALDVMFDVFAEDHLDGVAQEITLVDKLLHLVPLLKGKIKQQRKTLGEHLPVIMTAKTNLLRFIKYKNEQNKK